MMFVHYQYRFVGDGHGTKTAVHEKHADESPRIEPYIVWLVPGECALCPPGTGPMTDAEQQAATLDHLIWLLDNGRITPDAPERQEIASYLCELATAYRSGALAPAALTSGQSEAGSS